MSIDYTFGVNIDINEIISLNIQTTHIIYVYCGLLIDLRAIKSKNCTGNKGAQVPNGLHNAQPDLFLLLFIRNNRMKINKWP